MVAPRPLREETPAVRARVPVSARRGPTYLSRFVPSRGPEPRRGVARGPLVGVAEGEPFSPWGKPFLMLRFLSSHSSTFPHMPTFFSFRLKRTLEQAQPSMAKRLKTGAAPKETGSYFISGRCDVLVSVIITSDPFPLFRRLLQLPTSSRRREGSVSSRAYSVAADS